MYLAGHTCLSITIYDERYIFGPKLLHDYALKLSIEHYPKATDNTELVIPSQETLKIDSFPDADFSRMYGHKVINEPVSVKQDSFSPQCIFQHMQNILAF